MSVLGVFEQRYRGFRVVEIGGIGVLLVLILLVYLAKTSAGGEVGGDTTGGDVGGEVGGDTTDSWVRVTTTFVSLSI